MSHAIVTMFQHIKTPLFLYKGLLSTKSISQLQKDNQACIRVLDAFKQTLIHSDCDSHTKKRLHLLMTAALDEALKSIEHRLGEKQYGVNLLHYYGYSHNAGVIFYEIIHAALGEAEKNTSTLFVAFVLLQQGYQGNLFDKPAERYKIIDRLDQQLRYIMSELASGQSRVMEKMYYVIDTNQKFKHHLIWIAFLLLSLTTVYYYNAKIYFLHIGYLEWLAQMRVML